MNTIKSKLKKTVAIQFVLTLSTFIWTITFFWFIQDRRIDRSTVDDFMLYVGISFLLTFVVFYIVNFIGIKILSERELYECKRKCEYAIEQLGNRKYLSTKKYRFLKFHVSKMKEGKLLCPVVLYLLNAYDWLRPKKDVIINGLK